MKLAHFRDQQLERLWPCHPFVFLPVISPSSSIIYAGLEFVVHTVVLLNLLKYSKGKLLPGVFGLV